MAKRNNNKAITAEDIRALADKLDMMMGVLTEIKNALAPADAEPEEPVQLTLKEYGEAVGKYYAPEEMIRLGIKANDRDRFDIFDGDMLVLTAVPYRGLYDGVRRGIWDVLGMAQASFSNRYRDGAPCKMIELGLKHGVIKMHRRKA